MPHQIHPDLEYLAIDITEVFELPGNPNLGDVAAVARSYEQFGQRKPIVVRKSDMVVTAGNTQLKAARDLGLDQIAAVVSDDDEATSLAFAVADNRTAELGDTDQDNLIAMLQTIQDANDQALIDATGYIGDDLDELMHLVQFRAGNGKEKLTDDDDIPTERPGGKVRSRLGDVWLLGPHRLMCGDSTSPEHVATLLAGATPALVLADPPYGMGKEAQGVLNDNEHGENLDAFQLAWWAAWLPELAPNASTYIWGTAPDLWRLWWRHLEPAGGLTMRNEIVWDKGSGQGMASDNWHSYPVVTERCLFFMHGEQYLDSGNVTTYWDGYEPLRQWLLAQVEAAGWTVRDVDTITGTHMAGHWLGTSQFAVITAKHYATLQAAAAGKSFTADYADVVDEMFPGVTTGRREVIEQTRAQFDNTHDNMGDVWRFERVTGDDRHGHATPKPVAMMERALRSSSLPEQHVAVPFAGSGSDLIACDHTDRIALAMELHPPYVDVICRRYQLHTGTAPILESTGDPVDFAEED